MMSGVRASSIRMLSTSSTIAKWWLRWTMRLQLELHVVAEVVEAELVVGPVGDVAAVGDLALLVGELVLDDADRQPEESIDTSHPFRVAPGQIVVDGDDVNALAFERIQIGGERGDERLAFTGLHLGDGAVVKHHATDELHVVVPHVEHAAAGLADDGKRLREQIVERFAAPEALAEFDRLAAKLRVAERLDRRFEAVDAFDERPQTLQLTIVLGANDLGEKLTKHAGIKARCLSNDYTGSGSGLRARGRAAVTLNAGRVSNPPGTAASSDLKPESEA